MDLFEQHRLQVTEAEAPLAARMRPRVLEEFIGQDHMIGPGRLLRRAIQADQLSSLIFYGPPGTGKTTLARVIANSTRAHFIALNAVLAGVKDIREAIATAQERRGRYDQRTLLFVDEVHRFNKAQQDALLPWVENGTVILIGATTENPYFEVNKALVSRSRIFQLRSLTAADLRAIAQQALQARDRGYGDRSVKLAPEALDHLVNVANGDARALLNALELAVETTPPDETGAIAISLAVAEESIQRRAVLYDKEGDAHFDTISAFIKSVRGSDPDAALYWLARMVYGGEDPRFLFRRLLILASEDVGLADPQAVVVVNACAQAFDRMGLPEGHYPLAQATLYLATAPKSNSVMGFFDALTAVKQKREAEVPNPLKDASRDRQSMGHGEGYRYPHAYRDHWVAQQYLPRSLQGQVFYQPSDQGYEAQIGETVERRREAQIAAVLDSQAIDPLEVLTFGPRDRALDRWLQRTLDQMGEHWGHLRDRLFALAPFQRHQVVLDLNAGSGLLTWEALRRVPEGGVYAWVQTAAEAESLREQAAALPSLHQPTILTGDWSALEANLTAIAPGIRFDRIVGRNLFTQAADKSAIARQLAALLPPEGTLLLAEALPRHSQRLYPWLAAETLDADLYQRWVAAEERIYTDPANPLVNWDETDLVQALEAAGLTVQLQVEPWITDRTLTPAVIQSWFSDRTDPPSYATHLAASLTPDEIAHLHQRFQQTLAHQQRPWRRAIAFCTIRPAAAGPDLAASP